MSKRRRTSQADRHRRAGAMLFFVAGFTSAVRGQSVLTPTPSVYTTPPAVQEMNDQSLGYIPPLGGVPTLPSPIQLLQIGPVTTHVHLSYQLEYGTGLENNPGSQQSSLVQQFSPGVTFIIGTHWSLDYTPTFTFYSSSQFQDTIDHAVSLSWGTSYEDWRFSAAQTFMLTSDPTIQTGTQTTTTSYGTSIGASYAINSYLSMDFGASQNISETDQYTSSTSWSTMEWLNYLFFPRMDAGIGLGGGYDEESIGPNMPHENAELRYRWRTTDKVSFTAHGGLEYRQYSSGGQSPTIEPVYGVGLSYVPFSQTFIGLNLDRSTSPSYFDSQTVNNTILGLGLTQRFFGKFSVNGSLGYTLTDYMASAVVVPQNGTPVTASQPGRQDTTITVGVRTGYQIGTRISTSIFYTWTEDKSSQEGFSFTSSQVGLQVGYTF